MIQLKTENIFDTFFKHRDSLIVQYANGEITKREFLEGNFEFVQNLNVEPFTIIDSYEKGMYNYQYFNVLAKYYNMLASEIKNNHKLNSQRKDYIEKTNYYYSKKDKSTLRLLKFLEFKDMEAYFVKTESRYLNNQLYEIVLKNYEYAIFHSKSKNLLKTLKQEGVFIRGKKISLIDTYINQKY